MASRDPLAGFNKYRSLTRGSNFARRFQPYRGSSSEWSSDDPNQQGDPYWTGRAYSGRSQAEGAYIGRRQESVREDALRAMERYGEFLGDDDMRELAQIAETGQFQPRGEGKFINTLQTVDWLGSIVRSGVADLLNASREEFSWWDAIKATAPWANQAQRDKIPRDLWAEGEMFGFTGSQIMRNLGWDGNDLGTKVLRGTAGFVFDVATDPLTYATWGLAAVGKKGAIQAWRQVIRTSAKDAISQSLARKQATTRGGQIVQMWLDQDIAENISRLMKDDDFIKALKKLSKGDKAVERQLMEEAREALLKQIDDWSAIEATDELVIDNLERAAAAKAAGKKPYDALKEAIQDRLPFTNKQEGIAGAVREAWERGGLQNTLRDKQNELYGLVGNKQFKTLRSGQFKEFVELLPGDKAWAAGGLRIALPWGRAKHSSIYVGFATDRAISAPFRQGMDYIEKYIAPGLTGKGRTSLNSLRQRWSKDFPLLEATRKGSAWDHNFAQGLRLRIASTLGSIENPRIVQAAITSIEEALPKGIDETIVSDMLAKVLDQGAEAITGYAPKGFPPDLVTRIQEEGEGLRAIFTAVSDSIKAINPDFEGIENFFPMVKSQWYKDLMRGLAQTGNRIDQALLDAAPDLDTRIGLEYLALEQRTQERLGALSLTKMDENGHLRARPNLAFHGEHQAGDNIVQVMKPEDILRSGETINVSRTQLNSRISKALNFLQEQQPELFDKYPTIGKLGKGRKDFLEINAFDMDIPKVYDAYLQTMTKWFEYESLVRAGKVLGHIRGGQKALNIQATLNRILDGEASIRAEAMTPYLVEIISGIDELMGARVVKTEVAGELIGYVKRMVLENPKVKVLLMQIESFLKANEGKMGTIAKAMDDAVEKLVAEGMPEGMARQFVAASDGPVQELRRAIHASIDDAARQTDEIIHAVLAEVGGEVNESVARKAIHDALTEARAEATAAIQRAVEQYSSTVRFSFNTESQYVDLTAKAANGKTHAEGLANVISHEAKDIIRAQVEKYNPAALPELDKVLSKNEFTLEGVDKAMDAIREGAEKVYQTRAKEAWSYIVDTLRITELTWEEFAAHAGPLAVWRVLQDLYGFVEPEVIDNALFNFVKEWADDIGVTFRPRQAAGYSDAIGMTSRVADEYNLLQDMSTTMPYAAGDDYPMHLAFAAGAHEELKDQTLGMVRRLTAQGYSFQYIDDATWEMRQQALSNKVILLPRPSQGQAVAPLWGEIDEATGMRYIDLFDGVFIALGVGPYGATALDERTITNAWMNTRQLFKDVELPGGTLPVRDAHGTLTRGRYLAGTGDQPAAPKVVLMGETFTDPQPLPKGSKQSVAGTLGSEGKSKKGGRHKDAVKDWEEGEDTAVAGVEAYLKASGAARGKLGVDVAMAPGVKGTKEGYGVAPRKTKKGEVLSREVHDWWAETYAKLMRKVANGDMTQEQADRYFVAYTTSGDEELALAYSATGAFSLVDEPAIGGEKLYGHAGVYPVNQAEYDDLFEWLELEGNQFRKAQITRKNAEKIRKAQKNSERARFSDRYTGGFQAAGETDVRSPAQDVLTDAQDDRIILQSLLAVDLMQSPEALRIQSVVKELSQIQHDLTNLTKEVEKSAKYVPDNPDFWSETYGEEEYLRRLLRTAQALEEKAASAGRRIYRGERAKPYGVYGRTKDGKRIVLGRGGSKREAWEQAMGVLERPIHKAADEPAVDIGETIPFTSVIDGEERQKPAMYWYRGRTDASPPLGRNLDDVEVVEEQRFGDMPWQDEPPPIEIHDIEFDYDPSVKDAPDFELLDMPAGRERILDVPVMRHEPGTGPRATSPAPPREAAALGKGKPIQGNIFEMEGIPVIPTNAEGVHGKGLALEAKNRGLVTQGKGTFEATDTVVTLPTKTTWKQGGDIVLLADGLNKLGEVAAANPDKTYLLPRVGMGLGGLPEDQVMPLINDLTSKHPNIKFVTDQITPDTSGRKIISGMQVGPDQWGLEWAESRGLATGGTGMPGHHTAAGPNPELAARYGIEELEPSLLTARGAQYVARTQRNVDNADVTIAFIQGSRGAQDKGTIRTIGYAYSGEWKPGTLADMEQLGEGVWAARGPGGRKVFVIDLEVENPALNRIRLGRTTNIAGPRKTNKALKEKAFAVLDEIHGLSATTSGDAALPAGKYHDDLRMQILQLSEGIQRQINNKKRAMERETRKLLDLMPEGTVADTIEASGLTHGFEGLDFNHPRLASDAYLSLHDAAIQKNGGLEMSARQAEVDALLADPENYWNGNIYRIDPETKEAVAPEGGFKIGGLTRDPQRARDIIDTKQETPFQKGGLLGVRKRDIPEDVLRQRGNKRDYPDDIEYYVVFNAKEQELYDNFPQKVDEAVRVLREEMDTLKELSEAGPPYSETYNTLKELRRKVMALGGDEDANILRYAYEAEREGMPDKVRNVIGRTYDENGEWVMGKEPLPISHFITARELSGDFSKSVTPQPNARQFLANRSAEAVRDTVRLGDNHWNMLISGRPGGVLAALRSGDVELIAQAEGELRYWLTRAGMNSDNLVVDTVHGRPRVRWLNGDPIELTLDEVRDMARAVLPDSDGMTATEILIELGQRYGAGFDDLPSELPPRLQKWLNANAEGLDDITTEVDSLRTSLAKMRAEAAQIGAERELPRGAEDFLMRYDDWLFAVDEYRAGEITGEQLEYWFRLLKASARDFISPDELAKLTKVQELVYGHRVFGAMKGRALSGITQTKTLQQTLEELVKKLRSTVDEVAASSDIPKYEAAKLARWRDQIQEFLAAVLELRRYHQPPGSAVAETPELVHLIGARDREGFEKAMARLVEAIDGSRIQNADGTVTEVPGLWKTLAEMAGDSKASVRLRRWLKQILPPGMDLDNLDETTARWFDKDGNFQSKKFLYDSRQYLNSTKVEAVEDSLAIGPRGFVDPALYGIGGEALTDMVIEPWMGVMLENMAYQIRAAYTPYGMTVMGEYMRKVHNYWKTASTVLRPSFSPRNFVGGAFNAMAFGVSVNDFRWVGTRMARLKAAERGGVRWEKWAAKHMSKADQEVLHMAMHHGVIGTSFSSTISRQAAKGKPHLKAVQAGAIAMETVEDYLRLATFKRFYKVGSPETANFAANMALISQFDYKNLTKIEESITKYIPFFVWTRNNIPLQFRILMEKPGYANRYQHLMSNVNASFDESPDETTWLERQGMPTWMSGLTADLGMTMGKEGLWARLLLSPDVPLRDLEQLAIMSDQGAVGYAQWIGEMVSPLISLPLSFTEQGFNDEGWVNAPTGLSWAFRAMPWVKKRPVEGEGIQITQRARNTLETAIPFAREWTELFGLDPNESRRGSRLGYDYREGTTAGQRARAAALTLGKGFGLKTTTPADSIFPTGEGERRIQEIIQAAMMEGVIPQDYRYPGQRR